MKAWRLARRVLLHRGNVRLLAGFRRANGRAAYTARPTWRGLFLRSLTRRSVAHRSISETLENKKMVRASPPATQYLMGPLSWLAVEHSELRGPGRGESMRRRWCSELLAGDWRGGSRGKRPPRQCLALLSGRPRASCGSMGGPMSDGNGYGGRARQGQRRAVRPSLASPGGMGINASKIIIYRHYVLSTKGKMAPPARRAPENGPRRIRSGSAIAGFAVLCK